MSWTINASRIPVAKLHELGAMQLRLARFASIIGTRALADLLGVDNGNLSRMIAGSRSVPEQIGKRLLDLDHVLPRAFDSVKRCQRIPMIRTVSDAAARSYYVVRYTILRR